MEPCAGEEISCVRRKRSRGHEGEIGKRGGLEGLGRRAGARQVVAQAYGVVEAEFLVQRRVAQIGVDDEHLHAHGREVPRDGERGKGFAFGRPGACDEQRAREAAIARELQRRAERTISLRNGRARISDFGLDGLAAWDYRHNAKRRETADAFDFPGRADGIVEAFQDVGRAAA